MNSWIVDITTINICIEVVLQIGYWMCEGRDDCKQGLVLLEPHFLGYPVLVHP